ncbi:MAG: H4MPT-linked C1 transfer pathway protein [Gammaproteobacteria bacterium HGW-Gammaproteobacteria-3]|nr:MAG: H4MPT-linked C1 transfer pathway protein [Gammaproteobacteria bacterium HGW-Gammaproteobacteria-3]
MPHYNIGWDIGGAHLKAAVVDADGSVLKVMQQPCPLWKGMNWLEKAVKTLQAELPKVPCRHVVTMTGELVDLFDHREQGVETIIAALSTLLPVADLWVYAGRLGILSARAVLPEHYSAIASANWLASASYAAGKLGKGLLVDIGSTTTDIILFSEGRVQAQGLTDYQRLVSFELVYTGIVRTAVMAVAQEVLFKACKVGLMAEYFATMADVYRLTGELNEAHDQAESADGGAKTVSASARRLARMIGCEYADFDFDDWRQLAFDLRARQLDKIAQSCKSHAARGRLLPQEPFVGAGVGRFLVKQLAAGLGHDYVDFNDLLPQTCVQSASTPADCAPAIAIALSASGAC